MPSNDEDKSTEMVQGPSTFSKVLRTIWLVATWISMGAFLEIAGTTLKDFVYRLNSDYDSISSAYTGRSVGKFIGSILGGLLVDKFGRYTDFQIAVNLCIAAVTTAGLPWVQDLNLLWFMYFVLGTNLGIINIGGQRILLCTWLDKSASPMHIVHLGYGTGGFLAPLIVNPFLADFATSGTSNSTDQVDTTNSISSTVTHSTRRSTEIANVTSSITSAPVSRIEYAYIIIACYTFFLSLIYFVYQCKENRNRTSEHNESDSNKSNANKLHQKRRLIDMINPASCDDGNFCFGALILGFLFLRFFGIVGADRTGGTFLRSYAVDQLHFSKDDGSYINTAYWVSYSVGRLIGFIAARWVPIRVIMVIEGIGTMLVGICLRLFALDNQIALWVLAVLMGLFLGPMFPTGIAWGDYHIDMTGMAIMFVMLGSASGGFTFLKVCGYSYEKYGPETFTYLYLCVGVFILAIDISLTALSVTKRYFINTSYTLEEKEAKKNGVELNFVKK